MEDHMTNFAFARTEAFANLDQHIARAKANRLRNLFTIEVRRPGAWQWEEVAETGALRTYEEAEAIAQRWIGSQTRARINVRPHTRVSITVAEGFAA
jgi:hypothetical protein